MISRIYIHDMSVSNLLAQHAGRITLMKKDMDLARKIRVNFLGSSTYGTEGYGTSN